MRLHSGVRESSTGGALHPGEQGSERGWGCRALTDAASWRGGGQNRRSLRRGGAPEKEGVGLGGGSPSHLCLTCLAPVAGRFPSVPAEPRNTPRPLEAPLLRQAPPPQLTGIPRPPRSLIWRHSAATRLPPSVCPAGRARARDRPRRRAHPRAQATPPHAGAPGHAPSASPPNATWAFPMSHAYSHAHHASHPPIPCVLS